MILTRLKGNCGTCGGHATVLTPTFGAGFFRHAASAQIHDSLPARKMRRFLSKGYNTALFRLTQTFQFLPQSIPRCCNSGLKTLCSVRVYSLAFSFCGILLTACGGYSTAAEIGQKLLPDIAEELIHDHSSPRVEGMTSSIQSIFAEHALDDTTFSLEPFDANGETEIEFFGKHDHKRFLELKMQLKMSQDGYMIVGQSPKTLAAF